MLPVAKISGNDRPLVSNIWGAARWREYICLGGGFNCFLFSALFGKIPILTNTFQVGWDHQPVVWLFQFLWNFRCLCIWIQGFSSMVAPIFSHPGSLWNGRYSRYSQIERALDHIQREEYFLHKFPAKYPFWYVLTEYLECKYYLDDTDHWSLILGVQKKDSKPKDPYSSE